MKTLNKFMLGALLVHLAIPSQGQFIKKLKDKANAEINKVTGDNSSSPANSNNTVTGTSGNSSSSSANGMTSDQLKGVESTVIYQLEQGERIDYRESRIMIDANNKISGLVIVDKSGARYIVENGIKKGPYTVKNIPLGFLKTESQKHDEEINSQSDILGIYQNYIKAEGDKSYILFNGKKFGPFSQLEAMKVNPQKTKFVALVANDIDDNNKQKLLLNQDGKKIEIANKGMVYGQLAISPSFADAAFWGQNITLDQAQMQNPKTIFITLKGDKQEISPTLNNVWYDEYNNLLATNEKSIFLNGKVIKEGTSSIGSDWKDIWVGPNGNGWAALIDNQLFFSDGSAVNDGFSVSASSANNKTVINWVAVSKQSHAISRYSKTL